MFEKLLKFYIEKLLHIFVECDLFFCQARCFQNGGIIAGESGKRRKLGRAVMHGHLRMCFGNVVRKMDDIAVVWFHALCPPIWLLRSLAVAPSSRFIALSTAFLPNFFGWKASPPAAFAHAPGQQRRPSVFVLLLHNL